MVCQFFVFFSTAPSSSPMSYNSIVLSSTSVELSWSPPPMEHHNGIIRKYLLINASNIRFSSIANTIIQKEIQLPIAVIHISCHPKVIRVTSYYIYGVIQPFLFFFLEHYVDDAGITFRLITSGRIGDDFYGFYEGAL